MCVSVWAYVMCVQGPEEARRSWWIYPEPNVIGCYLYPRVGAGN